jgi:hypothetical protein
MDKYPPDALPLNAAKSRWVPAAAQKEEADALGDLFLRGEAVRRVDEASGLASVVIDFKSPTETNLRLLRRLREAQLRADAELVAMLRAGRLVAWGRAGSPLAPLQRLPADAWHTLRLTDIESGEARGGGVVVFGLRLTEPPAASAEPVPVVAIAEPMARAAEPAPTYSREALKRWYLGQRAQQTAGRPNAPPTTEKADMAAAAEFFGLPRIPRSDLRGVRHEVLGNNAHKRGPRARASVS